MLIISSGQLTTAVVQRVYLCFDSCRWYFFACVALLGGLPFTHKRVIHESNTTFHAVMCTDDQGMDHGNVVAFFARHPPKRKGDHAEGVQVRNGSFPALPVCALAY